MLLIGKDQPTRLPEEFHLKHNICAHIYDHLTDVITNKEYREYLDLTSFKFSEKEIIPDLPMNDEHILDWLGKNHKKEELCEILTKHIALSIVSDLVNFIYESLSTAQKGKLTVAYSLLRKPFTDELFILEQLLVDPKAFIEKFFDDGDPKSYDPSNKKNLQYIKDILRKAVNKCPNYGISEEFIYSLRYDKSCEYGINGVSNRALHLVTLDSNYRTSKQNLNFIFYNSKDHIEYWKHYYLIVPILLLHTANIVDELIFQFLPKDKFDDIKTIKSLQRLFAYENLTGPREGVSKIITERLSFECDDCEAKTDFNINIEVFLETFSFTCPKCGSLCPVSDEELNLFRTFIDLLRNLN
ncbi:MULTISPECIES: hypothetical protein [Sphingobacterium]|uniref:Uncharacterized protein n=1 Tax=Sphingobacterium multivorum TaxID=28454 RepID=A0A653ZRN3_SPHMU|nr:MULTISPECIES: hypothetical protein [Sphingobacterium]VXC57954.1 conserved hypothetical protein [Sphingobacterium multivorum]